MRGVPLKVANPNGGWIVNKNGVVGTDEKGYSDSSKEPDVDKSFFIQPDAAISEMKFGSSIQFEFQDRYVHGPHCGWARSPARASWCCAEARG